MTDKIPFRVLSGDRVDCEGTATHEFLDELHRTTRWDLWGYGENGYTEVSQYTIVSFCDAPAQNRS